MQEGLQAGCCNHQQLAWLTRVLSLPLGHVLREHLQAH